jgi:hypothetical protein
MRLEVTSSHDTEANLHKAELKGGKKKPFPPDRGCRAAGD